MGSNGTSKKHRFGGRPSGKIDASLNEKLQSVKWGEYKISEFLNWQPQKEIDPLKLDELIDCKEDTHPFYGQATVNNGIISYNQLKRDVLNNKEGKPTILIHSNNQNIVYVQTPFYLKDGHGATSVLQSEHLNSINQMFIIAVIKRVIQAKYSYNHKATKIELKNTYVPMPVKNGEIDYDFMESFVAELEAERVAELEAERVAELSAYLKVSGFDNYELSEEELRVLRNYDNGDVQLKEFKFNNIFNKIEQGRRLKKDDQLPGKMPFVMSGVTNNGVIGYISNPIASFPKNAITVDIFGNSFYRNYDFGAGDDTGVYWSDEVEYSKLTMLYFTAAIQRALRGRFSYGKKLRSSQSYNFMMKLPCKNDKPDFDTMNILISAIQKLVIKDVVLYADRKINETKKLVFKG